MAKMIYIIDDDFDYAKVVDILLSQKGFETKHFANGDLGFSAAKASPPDLIILDVMMTYDGEGMDVVSRLAADPVTRAIPILMVTGIRRPEDLPVNCDAVKAMLEKPVEPETLFKAVEKCLA